MMMLMGQCAGEHSLWATCHRITELTDDKKLKELRKWQKRIGDLLSLIDVALLGWMELGCCGNDNFKCQSFQDQQLVFCAF
eukprot:6284870-Amphidinium_carterae.1